MSRPGVRLVLVVFFLSSLPLCAETLAELFQKAKAQVKSQSWHEALTTLDQLDTESAGPGNETARQQLLAPIAFYRGVCEANLDQTEKAQADFATFLQAQPGATIDKVVYSKKAVAAFEAAGKGASSSASLSMTQRFEEFKSPPNMGEKPDDHWADGPVKWIMTAEESAAWSALTSGGERADFVEKFWEARNPKPGTDDNPVRTGFDRRVAFADAYFQVDEKKRGSLTDPGMVFVLLGPPTRTGRKPIKTGEDAIDSDGMSNAPIWWMSNRNSVHPDPTTANDVSNSFREIWHYRQEALPKGVSINELNVVFVTTTAVGRFVLQRDPAVLSALQAARSAAPASVARARNPS
jgi:GWxTD domain-containing protein